MSVSVIIPSRNEVYLQKTIESVCAAAKGDYEVIAVCDGYWPDPPIPDHPNVHIIHHTNPVGQRAATNEGVKLATKKYILKIDGHTILDEGFDIKLVQDCQPDWTVVPLMYGLDTEKWKKKNKRPASFMCIINKDNTLRTEYWFPFEKRPEGRKDIADLMSCMGNFIFMERDRYLQLGGLDENHGSWGQVGVEVALKSWLSGGRMVLNKKTWFAHLWRKQSPYGLRQSDVDKARNYSTDLWMNDKWPLAKKPLKWLIDKFAPVPTWEHIVESKKIDEFAKTYFDYLRGVPPPKQGLPHRWPNWKGIPVIKYPTDLINYSQIIQQNRPDFLIECGTENGGSAHFFADVMDSIGNGTVITIDKIPRNLPPHKRIILICGRSTACDTLAKVKSLIPEDKSVMVSLDSDHHRAHSKRELYHYSLFVTKGQYLVAEDCYPETLGMFEAVKWFLKLRRKEFSQIPTGFLLSLNIWLKRQ